jgi:hypothetical protein
MEIIDFERRRQVLRRDGQPKTAVMTDRKEAPTPSLDGGAPAHPSLMRLVQLLARQAAREFHDQYRAMPVKEAA